jgi:Ni,Fe-hydrogenase III small subunit
VEACPAGAIAYTPDHRLAATDRGSLVIAGRDAPRVAAVDRRMRRIFGRSLRLRQVCAGGAGASEGELSALGNVVFDLSRFGVQFVASPRHADGMVVTGPVTRNMVKALRKTWEAIPGPKIVIAVGTEAISGGLFRGSPEVLGGVPEDIPVDLYIPGHPPHPLTLLDGLLRLLGRIEDRG